MFSLIVGANWSAIFGGIMGGLFGLGFLVALIGFAMDCGRIADENQDKREQKEKEEARIRSLLVAKLEAEKNFNSQLPAMNNHSLDHYVEDNQ